MKKSIIAALAFSTTLVLTANTMYIREFPFMRTARLKELPGKIAAIPLDQKLYKNTNDQYSNIRIIDKDGRNVPFAVRNVYPLQDKNIYAVYPNIMSNFQIDKSAKTASADFTIKPAGYISRLTFPVEKENETRKVSLVFYNQQGQKAGEKKDIALKAEKNEKKIYFDFPQINAERIHITLKESDIKHLSTAGNFLDKLTIEQKVPLKIPGNPQLVNIDLPEISRFNRGNLTEITVDANRIPCSELILKNDNKKFSRYVEVFSKTKGMEKCIASQNFTQQDKGIPLQEVRGDYYIVRIYNANREPLKNLRLLWEVKKKVLMFIPPEKGDVKIYYGGNTKLMPYDIEYAERYGLPPQIYELEEETYSPDYMPQVPAINLYKYFMWVVIFIAGVFLFITIIRMLNKVQDIEKERNLDEPPTSEKQ